MITATIYTTADIAREHERAGGYFFSAGAKRFFRSRISSNVYQCTVDPNVYYFVTSEQFDYRSPRLYTVRRWNITQPRSVDTVGEFQQYSSSSAAQAAAKRLAAG